MKTYITIWCNSHNFKYLTPIFFIHSLYSSFTPLLLLLFFVYPYFYFLFSGPTANARYGNGENWSPTQIVDGEFTCESATFGATEPGVVPDSKGHCECDHSDSIGENGNCGSGYSQCSNYAIEKSSGSLAIYNNKGEGDLQLENYQFKVDILHSGGTHASVGVVFRYQDSKNYYRVVLTSWCTTLIRVTNGKSTKITGHYKSKGEYSSEGASIA